MVERFERFSHAITEIYRYWHKIAAGEMEKYGLKGSHSVILVTMYRYPQGITAARLCELSARDKGDISRMISTMEEKGLVKRDGTGKNQYRAQLKLTQTGIAAAEAVRQQAAKAVALAGADLTGDQRTLFYQSLESIAANLQTISQEGLPQESPGEHL